jgi:hypothetical protein
MIYDQCRAVIRITGDRLDGPERREEIRKFWEDQYAVEYAWRIAE